jgi:zinc transporter ZupT
MNVDALLAILLNVAIPSLLAVAGGALAIRALTDSKRWERPIWISVFIGLAAGAVVLAFVQQVRLTAQQKQSDDKSAANELRMSNDNKYMQGNSIRLTRC